MVGGYLPWLIACLYFRFAPGRRFTFRVMRGICRAPPVYILFDFTFGPMVQVSLG
jgi:hypothetical protein